MGVRWVHTTDKKLSGSQLLTWKRALQELTANVSGMGPSELLRGGGR